MDRLNDTARGVRQCALTGLWDILQHWKRAEPSDQVKMNEEKFFHLVRLLSADEERSTRQSAQRIVSIYTTHIK